MTVRRAMQPGGSLSLQDFIRRAQVLGLYRSFMRVSERGAPTGKTGRVVVPLAMTTIMVVMQYGRRVERADLRDEVLKQVGS